jgi:hypothetical protein
MEFVVHLSGVLLLFLLWNYQRASGRAVLSAVAVLCLGILVLSQNAQTSDIPLGVVITFLIYDVLRRQAVHIQPLRTRDLAIALIVVLAAPLMSVLSEFSTFVGYERAATRDTAVWRVEVTNLRGLAVPMDDEELAQALMRTGHQLLSVTQTPPREPVTPARYVQTLLEAASLFAGDQRGRPRILILDQVNPLPFALGYPPPRGGNLWIAPQAPARTGEEVFDDVDVVMVPKYSTDAPSTVGALTSYGEYLARRFPLREQTPSWTILTRRGAGPASLVR